MNFNDYQANAIKTDITSGKDAPLLSISFMDKVLGLAGESGEVLDKFKKILRDKQGEISTEDREELVKELGDVLWYIALVAHYLDVPLDDIARKNNEKLLSRLNRGALSGKGDNR